MARDGKWGGRRGAETTLRASCSLAKGWPATLGALEDAIPTPLGPVSHTGWWVSDPHLSNRIRWAHGKSKAVSAALCLLSYCQLWVVNKQQGSSVALRTPQ